MSRKITSFFGTSATTGKPTEPVPEKKTPERKNVRTLKSQTLIKWINDDLAKTNADVWLKHEDDRKGHVSLMKCSICTKFQNQIQHNRDFSDAWIKGTSNLRLSNASYLLLVTIILVISMEPNIPMLVLVTDTFYFVTGTISLMLVIVTGRAQKIIFRPVQDNH